MGGGDGNFSPGGPTPNDLRRRIEEAHALEAISGYSIAVAERLKQALARVNDRDTDKVSESLQFIKDAIENEIEGSIDLIFGGSVKKNTFIEGFSDIDSLVLLNGSQMEEYTPLGAKRRLMQILRDRLPADSKIECGKLAVTVTLSGYDIQLVPAIKAEDGYLISKYDGSGWSQIAPDRFSEKLTRTNRKFSGKLVPCIKLAKLMIAQFPDQRQMTGYHVEATAIQAFHEYGGPHTHKDMLKHFFKEAASIVMRPIKDRTGQTVHVDEYLSDENSFQRKLISDSLGRMARRMENADATLSSEKWGGILGE